MATNEPREGKTTESTKHQFPTGHQSPGTPPGTTTYETPEPKRRADEATDAKEPSANPERPAQHQPGYEAKQKAEEAKAKPKDEHNEHKPAPRSHAARRKPDVKHSSVKVKAKVKQIRKHK